MEQPKKKKKSVLRIIGNTVFFALIAVFATTALVSGIDRHTQYKFPLFGFRSSVIVSSSMANRNPVNDYLTDDMKQIQIYDVVTTKMVSYEDIQLYDVVTYCYNDAMICHRVIEKYENEDGRFLITKGDSNSGADMPINYDVVFRGKVIAVTPLAGKIVLFFQSPYFFIALFASVFFIALGAFIGEKSKEKKARQTAGNAPQPQAEQPVDPNPQPQQTAKPAVRPQSAAQPSVQPQQPVNVAQTVRETSNQPTAKPVQQDSKPQERPQVVQPQKQQPVKTTAPAQRAQQQAKPAQRPESKPSGPQPLKPIAPKRPVPTVGNVKRKR